MAEISSLKQPLESLRNLQRIRRIPNMSNKFRTILKFHSEFSPKSNAGHELMSV